MSDDRTSHVTAIEEHASAAVNEVRQALGELASLVSVRDRAGGTELLAPVERLVRGWAGFAEVAVGPLAQFVERQRELADQMAAWAQLQHELADRMAAWADMQRQLANGLGLWLTPVGGAAHVTARLLHEIAGEPEEPHRTSEVPAPRGKRAPAAAKRRPPAGGTKA